MNTKRKVLSEVDGFKTIIEFKEVLKPVDHVQIKFLTEWDNARRDGSEQVQYTLILSSEQRQTLKDFL